MRGQRKNPRKAVQPFENKKRKIDIFKNYEANGVEKIQRKLEIFSTLISKKSTHCSDDSCEFAVFAPPSYGCNTNSKRSGYFPDCHQIMNFFHTLPPVEAEYVQV